MAICCNGSDSVGLFEAPQATPGASRVKLGLDGSGSYRLALGRPELRQKGTITPQFIRLWTSSVCSPKPPDPPSVLILLWVPSACKEKRMKSTHHSWTGFHVARHCFVYSVALVTSSTQSQRGDVDRQRWVTVTMWVTTFFLKKNG